MYLNWLFTILSCVLVFVDSGAQPAAAAPAPAAPGAPAAPFNWTLDTSVYMDCMKRPGANFENCRNEATQEKHKSCLDQRKQVDTAKKDFDDKCSKTGIGVSGNACKTQLENCMSEQDSDSGSTIGSLTSMIGALPAAANLQGTKCNISGKDYFSEKDKVEKSIEDAKKKREDAEEAYNKAIENQQKTAQDLMQESRKAQKALEDEQAALDEEERKTLQDKVKEEAGAAEEMAKRTARIQTLRADMTRKIRETEVQMIGFNNSKQRLTCLAQVKDARKKMIAENSPNKGGMASVHSGSASHMREMLEEQFNTCMQMFEAQKDALLAKLKDDLAAGQLTLSQEQQAVDSLQKVLASSTQNRESALAAIQKKRENNLSRAIGETQAKQSMLSEAVQKGQRDMQLANTRMQAQDRIIQFKNNEIAKMKPWVPDVSISNTEPLTSVLPSFTGWETSHESFVNICCSGSDESKPYCKGLIGADSKGNNPNGPKANGKK